MEAKHQLCSRQIKTIAEVQRVTEGQLRGTKAEAVKTKVVMEAHQQPLGEVAAQARRKAAQIPGVQAPPLNANAPLRQLVTSIRATAAVSVYSLLPPAARRAVMAMCVRALIAAIRMVCANLEVPQNI